EQGGFFAMIDSAGDAFFARTFGPSMSTVDAVTIDTAGNIAVTGNVAGDTDFGNGTINTPAGVFFARYDEGGNAVETTMRASSDSTGPVRIAVDGKGNGVLAGSFSTTIDFGQGPVPSAGGQDVFLADVGP